MEPAVNPYQASLVAELATPDDAPFLGAMPPGAIVFSGVMTVEEALEAERLFAPGERLRWWGSVSFLLALALCLAVATASTWSDWRAAVGSLFLVSLFVGLAGRMVVQHLRLLRQARRLYTQRYGAYVETTGYVAPEELVSSTTFASTLIRWPAFLGYRASANIILLFWDNEPGCVMLARGKFASDEDWNAALAIIASRLGPI